MTIEDSCRRTALRQVAVEPVDRGLVGGGRLGGVVAGTGVVEEGVVDAGEDPQLVLQPGRGERRIHGVLAGVDPAVALGVDAEDRRLGAGEVGFAGPGP